MRLQQFHAVVTPLHRNYIIFNEKLVLLNYHVMRKGAPLIR
jgi:hypothetical protein